MVAEKLNNTCIEFIRNRDKTPLGSSHRVSANLSGCKVCLGTFADKVIDQEAERSFQNVMAILDEVAANEVAKPITSGSKYLWHPSIEFKQ